MKTIITVQHPQAVHHVSGLLGSWADFALTEKGLQQAENIGKNIVQLLNSEPYALLTSDLLRTRQTAEIIATYIGAVPLYMPELRERNLGIACGKERQWAKDNEKPCPTPNDSPFDGAESLRECWDRLSSALNTVEKNTVLVSHGGGLSILYSIWMGSDINSLGRFELSGKSGGVSVLHESAEGKRSILRLNDMSFVL